MEDPARHESPALEHQQVDLLPAGFEPDGPDFAAQALAFGRVIGGLEAREQPIESRVVLGREGGRRADGRQQEAHGKRESRKASLHPMIADARPRAANAGVIWQQ